jgi:2-hydroxychromene-2-carboxylate isomerase
MTRPTLEFWFDFASPYSYIGAARIPDLCRTSNVELGWKPFLLGPIFELQGWNTSHYNLNPLRGAYMWRDMKRLTTKLGLQWHRPSVFPRNTVVAARVAAAYASEPWIDRFIMEAFVANFFRDEDLNDATIVMKLLEQIEIEPQSTLHDALNGERRQILRANTALAIERGIFGAPTCMAGDEMFWGEEALEDAVAWAAAD